MKRSRSWQSLGSPADCTQSAVLPHRAGSQRTGDDRYPATTPYTGRERVLAMSRIPRFVACSKLQASADDRRTLGQCDQQCPPNGPQRDDLRRFPIGKVLLTVDARVPCARRDGLAHHRVTVAIRHRMSGSSTSTMRTSWSLGHRRAVPAKQHRTKKGQKCRWLSVDCQSTNSDGRLY